MPSTTCDLYDRFEEVARVSLAGFRQFGRCRAFHGFAVTVKCYEDNSRVRELCNSPGRGRVLVVDGGGSLRCALVGDQIAKAAIENGWSGLIVNGCIRDSAEIEELEIGIHALGTVPRKSRRREQGLVDVELEFGGVAWRPGDQVFADQDGVLLLDAHVDVSSKA
jgi:regulator of ribonuclease activity A